MGMMGINISDFIFLVLTCEGRRPVLSLTVSSFHPQRVVIVLVIDKLARGADGAETVGYIVTARLQNRRKFTIKGNANILYTVDTHADSIMGDNIKYYHYGVEIKKISAFDFCHN